MKSHQFVVTKCRKDSSELQGLVFQTGDRSCDWRTSHLFYVTLKRRNGQKCLELRPETSRFISVLLIFILYLFLREPPKNFCWAFGFLFDLFFALPPILELFVVRVNIQGRMKGGSVQKGEVSLCSISEFICLYHHAFLTGISPSA